MSNLLTGTTLKIFIIWNIIVFLIYGLDKLKSIKKWWRIPEKVLLGCAACFGWAGAYLGMMFFHHKTLHKTFSVGIPLIALAEIVLLYIIGK